MYFIKLIIKIINIIKIKNFNLFLEAIMPK